MAHQDAFVNKLFIQGLYGSAKTKRSQHEVMHSRMINSIKAEILRRFLPIRSQIFFLLFLLAFFTTFLTALFLFLKSSRHKASSPIILFFKYTVYTKFDQSYAFTFLPLFLPLFFPFFPFLPPLSLSTACIIK